MFKETHVEKRRPTAGKTEYERLEDMTEPDIEKMQKMIRVHLFSYKMPEALRKNSRGESRLGCI